MKNTSLSLLLLLILVGACKKENNNDAPASSPSNALTESELHEAYVYLDSAKIQFGLLANHNTGNVRTDTYNGLVAVADWLLTKEVVESAIITDSIYLDIIYASGAQTLLWLNYKDEEGRSKYRGGGKKTDVFTRLFNGSGCSEPLENKRILLWSAKDWEIGLSSYELTELKEEIEASPLGLEVDIKYNNQCTPEAFRNFNDYSLVMMDTHGKPDATMSGIYISSFDVQNFNSTEFNIFLLSEFGSFTHQNMLNNNLIIGGGISLLDSPDWEAPGPGQSEVWMHNRFISQSPTLENTILLNNSCYSGWTTPTVSTPNPVGTVYQSLNPLTYYGYRLEDGTSQTVVDSLGKAASFNMISRILDQDSTGLWHYRPDFTTFTNPVQWYPNPATLTHFRSPHNCFEDPCGILVDDRDQIEYQTACIGDKRWMAENLRYAGDGSCYENIGTYCEQFGRMYTIQELTGLQEGTQDQFVQGLCPSGWHVPTSSEYQQMLIDLFEDDIDAFSYELAAQMLASTDNWNTNSGSNESGMNIIPTGSGILDNGAQTWNDFFSEFNAYQVANLWTSSLRQTPLSTHDFTVFQLDTYSTVLSVSYTGSAFGLEGEERLIAPCRCIEDY